MSVQELLGVLRSAHCSWCHVHAKTISAKLYIYIGVGSRDLFIDEAQTALGIFPVFFPCMLPTPLCGIFMLKSTLTRKENVM